MRGAIAAVSGYIALAVMLWGCAAHGPLAVDPPSRRFAGLRDIELDLPPDGTLNVVLVHGMRADAPQTFTDLIVQLRKRLQLGEQQSQQSWPLIASAPVLSIDKVPLFDGQQWEVLRPRLTVNRYESRVSGKTVHVNFFIFEYWQALAYIKCRYVIAPDMAVIGHTARLDYCQKPPWSVRADHRLSSKPELANQWLKTEILEWGLSDAVIVTSQYRNVLRQAVGEALEIAAQDALAEAPAAAAVAPGTAASSFVPGDYRHRFAFVTESLGSYVISDALNAFEANAGTERGTRAVVDPAATERAGHRRRAVELAVCGATQVHMLANQLALLRLSEIALATRSDSGLGADAPALAQALGPEEGAAERRPHFFGGCPASQGKEDQSRQGVKYGARQVVAYHEPNDLLSYYTSDETGSSGSANNTTTNVVKPYATVWLPFLLADPSQAHTGQPAVAVFMDLVGCGHDPDRKVGCP